MQIHLLSQTHLFLAPTCFWQQGWYGSCGVVARVSATWKSPTNPGGWIFGCDPIPWFANRPFVKEVDEPGISGKPLNAKIGQVLRPMSNFVNATFFVRLKITDQSRGMNFRMWSHPLLFQFSMCKSSGRTRSFREATKRQNRASIAAYRSNFVNASNNYVIQLVRERVSYPFICFPKNLEFCQCMNNNNKNVYYPTTISLSLIWLPVEGA